MNMCKEATDLGGNKHPSTTPATTGGAGGNMGGVTGGNTSFDPQAQVVIYTCMFQMMSAGTMNPAMMGGMNPMMGRMGGGFGGGMRPGIMAGMGRIRDGRYGWWDGEGCGGRDDAGRRRWWRSGGGMNPNIQREPRGVQVGSAGAAGSVAAEGVGMGRVSMGPQRMGQRGQHDFHLYVR